MEACRGWARLLFTNITAAQEQFFAFWGTLFYMLGGLVYITVVYHVVHALFPAVKYPGSWRIKEIGPAPDIIEGFYWVFIFGTVFGLVIGNFYAAAHPPKANN